MSKSEFIALCEEHTIYYGIALENEDLRDALKANDIEEVKRILEEEF